MTELVLELAESNAKLEQCQASKQASDQRAVEMTQELENNAGRLKRRQL